MPKQSVILAQSTTIAPTRQPRVRPATLPLGELADRWVALMSRKRRASTVNNYRDHLLRFCEWMEGRGVTIAGQISPEYLMAYGQLWKTREVEQTYKAASVNNHLTPIRSFLTWLIAEAAVFDRAPDTNEPWITETRMREWLSDVPDTSRPTRKQRALSSEEVSKLLSVITEPRDLALFTLMAGSGLRVSECCVLRASDIEIRPDGNAIVHVINGKGGKSRRVVISSKVLYPLKVWARQIELRLNDPTDDRPLWPSSRSKASHVLTRIRVYQLLEDYAKAAGLNRKISPHNLRHTYATERYYHERNAVTLAETLGHSNLDYIGWYVKDADARDAKPFDPSW